MDKSEQNLTKSSVNNDIVLPSPHWHVIQRYKWRVLLFATLVSICTAFYLSNESPLYRASATLLIEADQAQAVSFDSVQGQDSNRKEYYLTQFEILKSYSIAETVFDRLNLQQQPSFQKSESWKDQLISYLVEVMSLSDLLGLDDNVDSEFVENIGAGYINGLPQVGGEINSAELESLNDKKARLRQFSKSLIVTPIRKTQLVKLSYDSEDPALAALIANAVGEAYIAQDLAIKSSINKNAAQWLGTRLEDLRESLDASESRLQVYRKEQNIIDLQDRDGRGLTGLVSNELEQTSRQLIEAKNEVNQLQSIVRAVNEYGVKNMDKLESIPEITSHPVIQNIKTLKVKAKLKVSELSQIYGRKHPELIAAKSELYTVNKHLTTQISKLVTGINRDLKTKQSNVAALRREYNKIQNEFQDVIGKDNEYQKLVRDVESNRKLYNTFLERSKETALTSDFNAAVARFTDRAHTPSKPITLSTTILVIIGFVLTIILHITYLLVKEYFTDNFNSVGDIEGKLGLPVLGVLPQIARKRNQDLDLHYFFDEEGRQFSESIRTLRTSFLLAQGQRVNQVIGIVSSQPNEGKSTTATNIAFSLAQIEKTLLIDADMRKPSLANNFKVSKGKPGLAQLITGEANLVDCIMVDKVSGAHIMTCGPTPKNAQELLSSKRFKQLLETLKQSYDRIIIDTPPIQAVSDSLIISLHTDAIIYVIKSEATRVRLVQNSVRRLAKVDANIVGVVMNHVNTDGVSDSDYYYGYYTDEAYAEKPSEA
ncbi:polysaccharide biosynthesis tyrosine autokinase [Moritella sp. F3]|uniref:GumC family protein n=1 Tax=Moritella sp. F3 TaxID=2718882 RepID=UPI0018E1A2B0|nr:polysaccharide biosynthesis tyrosine autokinase [Moritella sp. F3]GIC78948.1 chain-length determining protein [Moritella sp. F1]GIC83529.1 chain-length determining protein [Moritella sp. F3]